jgi:hypothetical protein
MQQVSPPVVTFYVFRRNGRVVATAIGQYPPDPGLAYDSLMRIPVVANGNRPPWRAFTWHLREPLGQALARSRWPDVEAATPPATPPSNRGKPRRRRSRPKVGQTITWQGERYRVLAISGNGCFARHTRTKAAVQINFEEQEN